MITKRCETYAVRIYMAGDIFLAYQKSNEYCYTNGYCVNIYPTRYIYTGGQEDGFVVELINYPRFPESKVIIIERARILGDILLHSLCQKSYTFVSEDFTEFVSIEDELLRKEPNEPSQQAPKEG